MQTIARRVVERMETDPLAAADGRRLYPVAPFSLRLAATVLLLAGNAWVVHDYLEFQNMLGEVLPLVSTRPSDLPFVTGIAERWGVWPVVVASAGGIAAIIYIWGFAQRVLPVILATVWAASLGVLVSGLMQVATEQAWE